jgi:hypothetical protein
VSKSRFPGATWAPIPEHADGPMYVKTQLIFHSTGTRASAAANRRYFARSDVTVESTLVVDYDGGALQLLDAGERADANTTASRRAISVEVVGEAHEPFTPAQLATCQAIAEWACAEHPIARRQIPEHDASGVGWHVMFGAPGPWTNVRGKECPGPKRIAQVRDLIIPGLTTLTATTTVQEDDEMSSFLFNADTDGNGSPETYLRDGGDTIHVPSMGDVRRLLAIGVKDARDLSPEMARRLLAAAKQ